MVAVILNNQFTNAFGCSHYIGRINRFVCRNKHHALDMIFVTRLSNIECTKNIVLYSLTWAVLHQRDMLMRRRMEYNIRFQALKYMVNSGAVTHRTNNDLHIKCWETAFKLILKRIGIIFIDFENDKLFRMEAGNLAAKLAANGTASACYNNRAVFQISADCLSI